MLKIFKDLADGEGIEPTPMVLETIILPLNYPSILSSDLESNQDLGFRDNHKNDWWSRWDSNPRPSQCKCDVLVN